MPEIYLDNAATTRVSAASAAAVMTAMTECWGNPSSRHTIGTEAAKLLRASRDTIAAELGVRDGSLLFTSGGTEANNTAVLGAARARRKTGKRVLTTEVEHSSVTAAAKQLEAEGFEVVWLPVDRYGSVSVEDVAAALTDDTVLVSLMLVNNETGAVNPIGEISRLLRRRKSKAAFHCDCVQGFGKLPVKAKELGCDMISVSGHKIHGPKGIGALWVSKDCRILPLHIGGSQASRLDGGREEVHLRPGTEPVPLIAGFAEAVRQLPEEEKRLEHLSALNGLARTLLTTLECDADVTINSPVSGSPAILSFATGCVKSETMLNFLSSKGICVSAGSACSKGAKSHVLTALGLPEHIIDSTLRVSFSGENTAADAEALAQAVGEGLRTLARFR